MSSDISDRQSPASVLDYRDSDDPDMDKECPELDASSDGGATSRATGPPSTRGSGKSIHTLTTKDSVVSPGSRQRRYEVPALPRRADFGDYYPDGGWGWVVCGASFVVHFLSHGLHLASGTLYMEIKNRFKTQPTDTAWLCALAYASCLLLSPFVSALCRRKSARLVAVVGGLVAGLGCLFLSFSRQLHQLLISSACALGLGTGITLSAATVIVGRYFQKRRECAEMLTLSGSGVGMAITSVFIKQITSLIGWMRSMQSLTGLMLVTVLAGSLYRSPALYHPRRRAILHIKNLRKTKKQQREFEDKPSYCDFSPLRMRGLQTLMLSAFVASFGTYVPFVLLPEEAALDGISDTSTLLLMVFLGVAFAFGCLLFGLIVIRGSLRCSVARRYLCQLAAAGSGLVTMLFPMAHGFNAFALYVWVYGLLCGGWYLSLKVYTCEVVTLKLSERSWGYVAFIQVLPTLVGPPVALYLNQNSTTGRAGFLFAGISMVTAALLLFFMPWATKHRSNHEVIQKAHLKSKAYEEDTMFLGMDVSGDEAAPQRQSSCRSVGHPLANGPCHSGGSLRSQVLNKRLAGANTLPDLNRLKIYYQHNGHPGGQLYDQSDDRWSDIEAMSPMSATDKVTEFLLHSQTMLQNYSQLHRLDLPQLRLEINNRYPSDLNVEREVLDEIKELKLEATIYRNSPKTKSASGSTSCGVSGETVVGKHKAEFSAMRDTHSVRSGGGETVPLQPITSSKKDSRGAESQHVEAVSPETARKQRHRKEQAETEVVCERQTAV